MWLLFVPILILVALLFMVGSLFAGLFWLVGSAWPWLLIGLGAWLFWHEDGRHSRRRRRTRPTWVRSAQPGRASADKQQRPSKPNSATAQAKQVRQTELPIDVQVKVEQIRHK